MRTLFLLVFLFSTLFSNEISAKYKVSFGIFGKVGYAETKLNINKDNNYQIYIHAGTTGLVNILSGEREEWYESKGLVDKNGLLIPNSYIKTKQRYSGSILKKDIRTYSFNHNTKNVTVNKTIYKDNKLHSSETKKNYYATNDLLSLFFNLGKIIPNYKPKKAVTLYAVGANKTKGKIHVEALKSDDFISPNHLLKVIINDKIFSSDKGELLINLQDNGLCNQAILKDVLLFGDIRGEIIDKKR